MSFVSISRYGANKGQIGSESMDSNSHMDSPEERAEARTELVVFRKRLGFVHKNLKADVGILLVSRDEEMEKTSDRLLIRVLSRI